MGDFEAEGGGGRNVDVVGAGALRWMLVLCGSILSAFDRGKRSMVGGKGDM